MANIDWKTDVTGSFNTAADWTPAKVPGSSDDAILRNFSGGAYTVTSSQSNVVGAMDIYSKATLSITAGTFSDDFAAAIGGGSSDAGTIAVAAGATFAVGGGHAAGSWYGFGITGKIDLNAATFNVAGGNINLQGNGKIILSNSVLNKITATKAGSQFQNSSETISGAGVIGGPNGDLTLTNEHDGVINASASQSLTINTGTGASAVTDENAGTIETTGSGGLVIDANLDQDGQLLASGTGALTIEGGSDVTGGGNAEAKVKGSKIVLNDGTLSIGGVISTVVGSSITTVSGNTGAKADTFSGSDIQNAGSIVVAANSTMEVNFTLYNTGTMALDGAAGAAAELEVFSTGATFDGTGSLILSNNANNSIVSEGADTQLTNRSTILGAGTIGDAFLRFVNRVGALVNANGSVGLKIVGDTDLTHEDSAFNAGVVKTTGAGGLTITNVFENAGILDAVGAGALTLDDATLDSGGGTLETTASGAKIILDGSAVTDGNASIAKGSTLLTTAGTTDALDIDTVNSGAIDVSNGSTLLAGGHWSNTGSVILEGTTANTILGVDGDIRLVGSGIIDLTSAKDSIASNGSAAQLRNDANKIEGVGKIGDANLTLQNEANGIINANATGGLTIDTGSNQVYNAGLLESTNTGGLTVAGALLNDGVLSASKGHLDVTGGLDGFGIISISGAGEVELGSFGYQDVHFAAGAKGELTLDHSSKSGDSFSGILYGFAAGDSLDLKDIAFAGAHFTYGHNLDEGTLKVTSGSVSTSIYFGDSALTQSSFHLSAAAGGGTLVTV